MLVGNVSMHWEEKTENRAWTGIGGWGWKLKGRDASAISKSKTGRPGVEGHRGGGGTALPLRSRLVLDFPSLSRL